jgi:hypothetical protein
MKIAGLNLTTPVWIGAAAVIFSPVLAPVARSASKRIAKWTITGGLKAYRMVKSTAIAGSEMAVDLYEEACEELAESRSPTRRKANSSEVRSR